MRMMRWAALALSAALVLGACGGDDDDISSSDDPTDVDDDLGDSDTGADDGEDDGGDDLGGDLNTDVPDCPFDEAQVSEITGIEMAVDENGTCHFRGVDGVALASINLSSQLSGSTTYDYSRTQADESYETLEDLDVDGLGYQAIGEIDAEAVLVLDHGAYTVLLSSFENGASYEDALAEFIVVIEEAG